MKRCQSLDLMWIKEKAVNSMLKKVVSKFFHFKAIYGKEKMKNKPTRR